MTLWDWSIVAAYGLAVLAAGLVLARKAAASSEEYFLSGRRLSWYVLGLSLVATSFAADTPLAVTEIVRTKGIWGNWIWWIWAISHVLAVFLFSRLWRRAEVTTDAEFIELRYRGRSAATLRGVKAAVMALGFNLLVMGWVTQAMGTIIAATLDMDKDLALGACALVAIVYTTASGLWGVVVSDVFQFAVAMVGAFVFAGYAVQAAGGLTALADKAQSLHKLSVLPPHSALESSKFLILLSIGWLATHNADAGGYTMQRLSAARNERHAVGGSILFVLCHYVLRVWPWILVALASLVLLPDLTDHKAAYPILIMRVLPTGLKGLLVASLLAAYMSTIDTHLNWGASYLVTDIYQRFWKKDADQHSLVRAARVSSLGLALAAVLVSRSIDSITGAWTLLYSMGAGLGPALILRWFWWRVTALAELAAMLLSLAAGILLTALDVPYEFRLASIFSLGMLVTILVSLLTGHRDTEHLEAFYDKVRPGGWWGPVSKGRPGILTKGTAVDVLAGLAVVYGLGLGMGKLLFSQWAQAAWLLSAATAGGAILWMRRGSFGGHSSSHPLKSSTSSPTSQPDSTSVPTSPASPSSSPR